MKCAYSGVTNCFLSTPVYSWTRHFAWLRGDTSCVFLFLAVGVVDTTDPIINGCPSNIEIVTPVGEPEVVVTWNEPSGFDNSGRVTVTQSASPGDIFGEGVTQVVYQFSDASGNDAFCIFTVTVIRECTDAVDF